MGDFSFYYLYGFTNNPNLASNNFQAFNELYQLVIGPIGGVCIANACHPYFTINAKGLTVWGDAYVKLAVNNNAAEIFRNIKNEHAVYSTNISAVFNQMNIWPDTRLTYEENPAFSKYVPFIIPFLVHKSEEALHWDTAISNGVATKGNATAYVEQVNNAIRFFMPAPAFIIGFDEFDETNPSGVIDKFIACKPMLGI
jgi:hypothetical protein